jgi:uncharacterized integral membrane protein
MLESAMSSQPPPPPQQQPPAEKPGLGAGGFLSLLGAGILLIFMLQNRQDTPVHFLFWRVVLPVWFIILASALLGAVVWLGFGVLRRHRRRVARRRERRG